MNVNSPHHCVQKDNLEESPRTIKKATKIFLPSFTNQMKPCVELLLAGAFLYIFIPKAALKIDDPNEMKKIAAER